jgi:hypothetical protein
MAALLGKLGQSVMSNPDLMKQGTDFISKNPDLLKQGENLLGSSKGKDLMSSMGPDLLSKFAPQMGSTAPTPEVVSSGPDMSILDLEKMIDRVFEKHFPLPEITRIIEKYIQKLSADPMTLSGVQRAFTNFIFKFVNTASWTATFKQKTLWFLLSLPSVQNYINQLPRESFFSGKYIDVLKAQIEHVMDQKINVAERQPVNSVASVEDGRVAVATTGGRKRRRKVVGGADIDPIQKMMETKVGRVMDVDLPQEKLVELFMQYLEKILNQDNVQVGSLKQTIYKHLDGFIHNIFNAPFFKNDEIALVFSMILLSDPDIERPLILAFQNSVNLPSANAPISSFIQQALKEEMDKTVSLSSSGGDKSTSAKFGGSRSRSLRGGSSVKDGSNGVGSLVRTANSRKRKRSTKKRTKKRISKK